MGNINLVWPYKPTHRETKELHDDVRVALAKILSPEDFEMMQCVAIVFNADLPMLRRKGKIQDDQYLALCATARSSEEPQRRASTAATARRADAAEHAQRGSPR